MNTSLCVGNGVCMAFEHMYCLCMWPQVTLEVVLFVCCISIAGLLTLITGKTNVKLAVDGQ